MSCGQILVLVLFLSICPTYYAKSYHNISLPSGVEGPETIAFDCYGKGPYVGVSDGRILRLDQSEGLDLFQWTEFATMPNWSSKCINQHNNSSERQHNNSSERACGRPLGLKFHPRTCKLYVADAYNGLVVVSPEGGRGISVASGAEEIPFKFTNSLDIDPVSGIIYFTDSSTQFERWQFDKITETEDNTGRLMTYNPRDHKVSVLLNNLRFANGVALSQRMDFLLFSETSTGKIHKYWLRGPRRHTTDMLVRLQGRPDNINRDFKGNNFWIAQVPINSSSGNETLPLKINEHGRVIGRLYDPRYDAPTALENLVYVSDIKELNGKLWIGSVVNNFVELAIP